MPASRRTVLLAALAAPALVRPGRAAPTDPRMGDRAEGSPTAPVTVQEWFSLTCTHCARFANTVFPDVKTKLIDTGKLRYVFKDYPLDQTAMTAAMVARSLPPDRYEPFVLALFQTQQRWAFDAGANSTDEIAKMAALAGMPRALFDKTIADDALRTAIAEEAKAGEDQYHISATPTFVNGTRTHSGEFTYDEFARFAGL